MKILLALLFLSLPSYAQYAHRQNPGVAGGTAPTIAALGACPGTGCVSLNTSGTSVMMATIVAGAGCPGANCTLQFACTKDNWATSSVVAADLFSGGSLAGAPATTTTVAGVFIMPTYSFPLCGVLASVYASGTATVSLDADPAFLPAIGATGAAAQQVEGTAADGSPALGNPILIAGVDANTTNVEALSIASPASAADNGITVYGADAAGASRTVPVSVTGAAVPLNALMVGGSDGTNLQPVAVTAKATQGAKGLATQDLKDSGRSMITLNADGVTPAASNTVITHDRNVAGTVTTGQTTYTITSGKTFRVQQFGASITDTGTTAVRAVVYFRLNNAGACVAASGKVLSCELSTGTGTLAANEGGPPCNMTFPDGIEIVGDGTKSICLSEAASGTGATLTANLIGFEY